VSFCREASRSSGSCQTAKYCNLRLSIPWLMTSETKSASDHTLALAQELLDDIELSRLSAENLLLKATRLARLVKDDEIRTWLHYELTGFVTDDPISLRYMTETGRWTDFEKKVGYWKSLPELDYRIAACRLQIQQLRVPDIHFAPSSANPHELVGGWGSAAVAQATAPVGQVLTQLSGLHDAAATFSAIRSSVLALLHQFVVRIYYELTFSGTQETIFERQKALVETKLAATCGAVLEKFPAVYNRLAEGDPEAISQALSTCRRIIDAFADAVFPPSDETLSIDGNEIKLTAQHHQNRINAYVHGHCGSVSRRKRLRRALEDIYGRVSAGVHSDVSPDEARMLFLHSYLLMGEVVSLPKTEGPKPQEAAAS
jgi:AbiTii